jgi:hypothetical protein
MTSLAAAMFLKSLIAGLFAIVVDWWNARPITLRQNLSGVYVPKYRWVNTSARWVRNTAFALVGLAVVIQIAGKAINYAAEEPEPQRNQTDLTDAAMHR